MGLFGSGAIRINFSLFDFFCHEDVLICFVFLHVILVLGLDSLCPWNGITAAAAATAATVWNSLVSDEKKWCSEKLWFFRMKKKRNIPDFYPIIKSKGPSFYPWKAIWKKLNIKDFIRNFKNGAIRITSIFPFLPLVLRFQKQKTSGKYVNFRTR